jgi:hypothetical protein
MGVLAPGTVLGGCRIDAVVGRGGMGVVYRARQLDLDRDVALKVIAPELVEDPRTRKRFLTEARAAGAVEHPNVVPVHGAGVAEGRAYLVMRYVAGDDLRALVRREGPFSPERAADVAMQLGDALDAIHAAGYVHRDVKPQNVMVDAAGHVYLSDFGLAKETLATIGPTTSEQWVGTLDYVAPEQIRGERVDARADVYAAGGVLYFMLTGHVPFERANEHAKLWAHLADPPPLPSERRPELPAALDAVVARALAKDPGQRQPSAGDLGRAALDAASGSGRVRRERTVARGAAAATTIASRSRVAPPRSGRRLWPALAAAALTAVAGIAALVLLGDPDRPADRRTARGRQPAATPPQASPTPVPARVGMKVNDVGRRPSDVEFVRGQAWVVSNYEPRIASIDAETGDRDAHQPWIGTGAADITRDGNTVWVAGRARRAAMRFSARTGEMRRFLRTGLPATRVAAGPSGLWVVGREEPGGPATLLHYDRMGLNPEPSWKHVYPGGISALALGGGHLWVALEREKRVLQLRTDGAFEHSVWLDDPANALAYGDGYLWASLERFDSIVRIDPRTWKTPTQLAGRHPKQLVVVDHRVFVAGTANHRVIVFDARTFESVDSLQVPSNPYGMAAGGGSVWVTGIGTNTLTRIDL